MKYIIAAVASLLFISCLHSVNLEMFPKTKQEVDYKAIKSRQFERNSNLRFGSTQEYYFKSSFQRSEVELLKIIDLVMTEERFKLKVSDINEDYLIYEKGLSAEAWNSMIGVYYDINPSSSTVEMYLVYKMTQDVTGSLAFNYAEIIGQKIQYNVHQKTKE